MGSESFNLLSPILHIKNHQTTPCAPSSLEAVNNGQLFNVPSTSPTIMN